MISLRARATSTWRAWLLAHFALAVIGAVSCVAPQRKAGTLVMASGADLESANPLVTVHPLAKQVQRFALLVTLTRYDSLLQVEPYFARSWRWLDGGRALSLTLASDLDWHDGKRTTARDAAFTLLAAKDPATGYSRSSELKVLDTAVATSDTELLLRFTEPQTKLPALMSELPLVPEHILHNVARSAMRTATFNDAPTGNGPFRFRSRVRGSRWTFERNATFSPTLGGPPRLEGFTVAIVDEATTKFAGLASGELDVAGISPTMASLIKRDATLTLLSYPVLFGSALCFNVTRPPFDDLRVRRAVSRAIDRGRIAEVAFAGFARATSSPVPPDNALWWKDAPSANIAESDALLDSAGWRRGVNGMRSRNGVPFEITLITVGSGDNVAEQLIQSDLGARGIAMKVRQIEMGAFLTTARATRKQFDLLIAGIPGDLSLSYVQSMFASDQQGGALDCTGFHSPSLDTLLERAARAPAGDAGISAWHDVQVTLDSLAPATWLYHSRGVQGISRRVDGVRMDLRGELVTLHDWRLAPSHRP